MIPIAIFTLSTIILTVGLINLRIAHFRATIIGIFIVALAINGLDVFVEGNQTLYRQIGYLLQAVILSVNSLRQPKGYKLHE